jgi:hypothetical protein
MKSVIEVKSVKVPAPTDAAKAKADALACVCIEFALDIARKQVAEELGRGATLNAIKKSILELGSPEAHSLYRSNLSDYLTTKRRMIKEAKEAVNKGKATFEYDGKTYKVSDIVGSIAQQQAFNTFTVRCSQWSTFSKAVSLGFTPSPSLDWNACYKESAVLVTAHAKGESDAAMPTRRKAGRKETPALEKMLNAIAKFREAHPADFMKVAAWVEREVKSMQG